MNSTASASAGISVSKRRHRGGRKVRERLSRKENNVVEARRKEYRRNAPLLAIEILDISDGTDGTSGASSKST